MRISRVQKHEQLLATVRPPYLISGQKHYPAMCIRLKIYMRVRLPLRCAAQMCHTSRKFYEPLAKFTFKSVILVSLVKRRLV
jgi:hypothetical protein